ncbi:uncharacterized [Tachysurus ichikawai]
MGRLGQVQVQTGLGPVAFTAFATHHLTAMLGSIRKPNFKLTYSNYVSSNLRMVRDIIHGSAGMSHSAPVTLEAQLLELYRQAKETHDMGHLQEQQPQNHSQVLLMSLR